MLAAPGDYEKLTLFTEPCTPDLLWWLLSLDADTQEQGRRLFSGGLGIRNRRWREMSNYVRQAHSYHDVGLETKGTTSALPYYYAALQLAKAELLIHNPPAIENVRIPHGLTYRPDLSHGVATDVVRVQHGVFPMLYEKRVGRKLPVGTILPISRLVANIPEIGWDLRRAGLGESRTSRMLSLVATSGPTLWTLIGLSTPRQLLTCPSSRPAITASFEEVAPPNEWRDVFAVSRRSSMSAFYESRAKIPMLDAASGISGQDISARRRELWTALRLFIDVPTGESEDAYLAPSLYRSRFLAMPPDMARYALLFYLSSLVRYKPSLLDGRTGGAYVWLFESFLRLAPDVLLRRFSSEITQQSYSFAGAGTRV